MALMVFVHFFRIFLSALIGGYTRTHQISPSIISIVHQQSNLSISSPKYPHNANVPGFLRASALVPENRIYSISKGESDLEFHIDQVTLWKLCLLDILASPLLSPSPP